MPRSSQRDRMVKQLSKLPPEEIDGIAHDAKRLACTPRATAGRKADPNSNDATIWAHVEYRLWRDPSLRSKSAACKRIVADLNRVLSVDPLYRDYDWLAAYNRAVKTIALDPETEEARRRDFGFSER